MENHIVGSTHLLGIDIMTLLDLIKANYKSLDDSNHQDIEDYLHIIGKPIDAIIYSCIFCPELIELNDSILLQYNLRTEEVKQRFASFSNSNKCKPELEKSFNLIEIPYLFSDLQNFSDDEIVALAEIIQMSWSAWLKFKYPGRIFVVKTYQANEETGETVSITFWEEP